MEDAEDAAEAPRPATLELDLAQEGGGWRRVNASKGWLAVSRLKMPHLAPEAGYEDLPRLRFESGRRGEAVDGVEVDGYFFRTRESYQGDELVSAHYGKVMGDIRYTPIQKQEPYFFYHRKGKPVYGSLEFVYYFNPEAGDRNLEYDHEKGWKDHTRGPPFVQNP